MILIEVCEMVFIELINMREQLHRCVSHFMFNTKQMLGFFCFVLSTMKVTKIQ